MEFVRFAEVAGGGPDGRDSLKTLAALLVGRGSRSTLSARLASLSKESRGTIQGFSTVS